MATEWRTNNQGEWHCFYMVPMSEASYRSLAWIADRYTSAEVLYDGSTYNTETGMLEVPEHVAWDYSEELPRDNGVEGAILPPCAGGELADVLIAFWEEIV